MTTKWNERGSEWNRWDPHIHSPGTVLNDGFKTDWEGYLAKIEKSSPVIRALGVTDYCCISTYEKVREFKDKGRLANIDFIFPNVELRLDIKTDKEKAINIHLLFSPEDSDHETQIERVLRNLSCELDIVYHCSRDELMALGRKHDPTQKDDFGAFKTGVNQFKVSFKDLKTLFQKDPWIRENCVVAVAGGKGDGSSGITSGDKDGSAFSQIREDMEKFSHIIFSSNPNDREFWLGRKSSIEEVEKRYRFLKPCFHGSDAHKVEDVGEPKDKRYCWVKGDFSFETIRQAIVEPEERVLVAEEPPLSNDAAMTIARVKSIGTPWLKKAVFELNPGLVSVIGARGSGKTALIDIIAAGAYSLWEPLGESSFLKRATQPNDLIGAAKVVEEWGDGEKYTRPFEPLGDFDDDRPLACYLSQHFVNRLCSSSGLAEELVQEIERVIFDQTEKKDRYETNSFKELSDYLIEPVLGRRQLQVETIQSLTQDIAHEEILKRDLLKLANTFNDLAAQIEKANKEVKNLLNKGEELRARRLLELEAAVTHAEGLIEAVSRRKQSLNELLKEIDYINDQSEPQRLTTMKADFAEAGLSATDWDAFKMQFKGEVKTIIANAKKEAEKKANLLLKGDVSNPPDLSKGDLAFLKTCPLEPLQAARDKLRSEVGIDKEHQKRYKLLQESIATNTTKRNAIQEKITHAKGADARKLELANQRRAAYKSLFETFDEQKETLKTLYDPLQKQIAGAKGALGKLSFAVRREVDFEAWVKTGEALIDLRKDTRFRGAGSLKQESLKLLIAWRMKTPDGIAKEMDDFIAEFKKDLIEGMPQMPPEEVNAWMSRVGNWLFSADHIYMQYALEYDGVEIERLSPGTRGIVLLLLYLAIDTTDRRPLIIDQPEENLDPKSVFEDLVPHFREARKRRQIIIVTHNANLVVNTDADQVIVATSEPAQPGKLPDMSYDMGSLENPKIRNKVCEILEGGERAFLERERRYRLEWERMLEELEEEVEIVGKTVNQMANKVAIGE
jgi:energy-coupling factor transporter ATP-binding protein EcfA2